MCFYWSHGFLAPIPVELPMSIILSYTWAVTLPRAEAHLPNSQWKKSKWGPGSCSSSRFPRDAAANTASARTPLRTTDLKKLKMWCTNERKPDSLPFSIAEPPLNLPVSESAWEFIKTLKPGSTLRDSRSSGLRAWEFAFWPISRLSCPGTRFAEALM